jgi:hypothetical protein
MSSIKPIVNEKFAGEIWRMEIDDVTGTLFIEVRNSAERLVSFSAVDLENGDVLFKDVTAPERWLTGMEAAYDGILLLHFYENESGPTHRGLMAIDGNTGAQLWSNFTATFDHLSVSGPVIYDARVQPAKLLVADIHTGATIRPYQPSVDIMPRSAVVAPGTVPADGFALVPDGVKPVGNWAHYHEHNNFRIVSLHALAEGLLNQLLFVFEGTEAGGYRQVFEDILNAGIQKMQPEAFIIYKNHLIYIKNRAELVILNL